MKDTIEKIGIETAQEVIDSVKKVAELYYERGTVFGEDENLKALWINGFCEGYLVAKGVIK